MAEYPPFSTDHEADSSASPSGQEQQQQQQQPRGIGYDLVQRQEYIAALNEPRRRIRRKRKAGEEDGKSEDVKSLERERNRRLAREAAWCAFLTGTSKPELVGAAIRKIWGVSPLPVDYRECLPNTFQESARAEQAAYQSAKITFQNHLKRHKNTTLAAMEAWITSEMKTPSIRANLMEASHRGRILYFENQFSVAKFFQIFRYLGGIFNFEQSEPVGQWYCKCESFFFCQCTDSVLHLLLSYGINISKLMNVICSHICQSCSRDCRLHPSQRGIQCRARPPRC